MLFPNTRRDIFQFHAIKIMNEQLNRIHGYGSVGDWARTGKVLLGLLKKVVYTYVKMNIPSVGNPYTY